MQVGSIKTRVESAYGFSFQRLKLEIRDSFQRLPSISNLRRYIRSARGEWSLVTEPARAAAAGMKEHLPLNHPGLGLPDVDRHVIRCRLISETRVQNVLTEDSSKFSGGPLLAAGSHALHVGRSAGESSGGRKAGAGSGIREAGARGRWLRRKRRRRRGVRWGRWGRGQLVVTGCGAE